MYANHSFWLDETTSTWVIDKGFSEIFARSWVNNLSPLYYSIIYTSKLIFGYSEFSLRIPGMLIGVLTIPLAYLLAYKLSKSNKLSLLAAFLISVDHSMIFYSLELRPYAFVIFFVLLHLYIFLFLLEKTNKIFYAIILGVLTTVLILLHYTTATIFLVELTIIIYDWRRVKVFWENRYALLIYILVPFILLLPFFSHIMYLLENNDVLGSFVGKEKIESVFWIHSQLSTYILFPLMVGIFFTEFFTKKKYKIVDKSFLLIFFIAWYFVPALFHWVLTKMNFASIYLYRYLAWTIPAAIIGSVVLIDIYKSKWAKILTIALLVFFSSKIYISTCLLLINPGVQPVDKLMRYELTNSYSDSFGWENAVDIINNSALEPAQIFVKSGLVEGRIQKGNEKAQNIYRDYLLSPVNSIYKLDSTNLLKSEPINSIEEIPKSMTNYIVVGLIDAKHFNNAIVLNANKDAEISVLYFK